MSPDPTPVIHLAGPTALEHSQRVGAPLRYRSQDLARSIVHIGVGGFHRAHLATFVHDLCQSGSTEWGIVGAGILPHDAAMAKVLGDQDGLYTLITRGDGDDELDIIASIVDYLHVADDPEPLIAAIADAETQIVSLTITEGGYPIDDVTGDYLSTLPTAGPTSAFGIIARGLERRMKTNGAPVTIISCDNIMSNGEAARRSTVGEAAQLNDDLVAWINSDVAFPNSMVDRITPGTTDDHRTWLLETHGIADGWPVVTEPFRQWVIEDHFAGKRLPLEQLDGHDVIVTDDVEPYEIMKLRLLNSAHSCLAYLSALEDIELVDQAMADDDIRTFVHNFLHTEAKAVLPPVHGIHIDGYIDSLVTRFANPAIGDQISRLCLDGTAKFPKFLLPTVRRQLEVDGPVDHAALALAGWCEYLRGTSQSGASIEPSADPLLTRAVEHATGSVADPATFLDFTEVFGDLGASPTLRTAFTTAAERIRTDGVRSALRALT